MSENAKDRDDATEQPAPGERSSKPADEAAASAAGPQPQTPPSAETPPTPGVDHETADGQIARLRAELEEVKDRSLRYQAELDNYRKRAARQIEEERRYACMGLIRDLLPVWDNTIRAIEAAQKTQDIGTLVAGFKMVADHLEQALKRHHCTRIAALHQPFDPHLHEAISQIPSAEYPANTVVAVMQEGFQLHDRVVRPSQVVVSAPPPGSDSHLGDGQKPQQPVPNP